MTGEGLLDTALRYAGCRGAADEGLVRTAQDCLDRLQAACSPAWRWVSCAVTREADGVCRLDDWRVTSRRLADGLTGCDRAVLFAATLGTAADRLLLRESAEDMSRAVLLQAAAAAYLEHYGDTCLARLREQMAREGVHLRLRVSPGDGDFALDAQRELLTRLDATRRIGVTLTDALMLLPSKTVTAVIGLTRDPTLGCNTASCAGCDKKDCRFRYTG